MQWFKFDPTVVGTIVEDLDLSGQGAYFKLMRSLWVFGPLSEAEVRRKCGPTFEQLRELMCPVGECLSFEWIEALRSEGQHVSDVRAAAATVRHSKQKEASDVQLHANALQLPSISISSSFSKSQEGKERAKKTPEDRKAEFVDKCRLVCEENQDRLPKRLRSEFMAYWTEPSADGKMRFEGEKYFDHGRRMDTWKKTAASRGELTPKEVPVAGGWNPRA